MFYQNSPKIKLFLQNNAKFLSAGGSAPRPKNSLPPLQIPAYVPGLLYLAIIVIFSVNFSDFVIFSD